jgi:hypothetical protein
MDARTSRRQKRISFRQEKQAAADVGGRLQANSGATAHGGGDVRVLGHTRVECKYTEACSYTLRLGELVKLRDQAVKALEQPVLQFQFRGRSGTPIYSFAVLPAFGGRDLYRRTTSRQMNFHEWDLNQWFFVNKSGPMRISFVDKVKDTQVDFDIFEWNDFLERRAATDA